MLLERGIAKALSAQTALTLVPLEVIDHVSGRYSEDLEAAVYFCCQEAIQNAVKHAHASHISVRLDDRAGTLQFAVSDDGTGFDLDEVRGRGGLGLIGIEERVRLLKGKVTVAARPGDGTHITVTIPVPESRLCASDLIALRSPDNP